MAGKRFSKQTVREELWRRIERMEQQYRFRRTDGNRQVAGRGEEINRAYGEYLAYLEMLEEFEL